MSFSDYNCRLIMEPVSLLSLFCSSIARKRRQSGRRGKRVPLLPHEAELLEGIGEEEISQLLSHQDRIQERRRKPRPEEESSSSSSSASTPSLVIMQSEGETEEEEEAVAATPTSAEQEVEETCPGEAAGDAPEGDQPDAADAGSEVFILELHPVDEESNLPASGWPDRPSSAASPGPFHPPVSPPPPGYSHGCCLLLLLLLRASGRGFPPPPPPSRATYRLSAAHFGGPRKAVRLYQEARAFLGPPQSPPVCGSGEVPKEPSAPW
ncbi:uncharacterized protein LOC143998111 [Lithobates pipiens]